MYFSENREDVVDGHEMEAYLMCVLAVQRLMQAERTLMAQIIPSQNHNSVFQSIVQESVDSIVQNGEVSQIVRELFIFILIP